MTFEKEPSTSDYAVMEPDNNRADKGLVIRDHTRPQSARHRKNFITLLFVSVLLADVVACSLLVVCLYVCSEFGLVGWLSQPNTDASCQLHLHIHQTPRWTTHKKRRRQRGSRVNSGVEKKSSDKH